MDVYIEAGAHNGQFQSNTLDFDKDPNSVSILVEPCSNNFKFCKVFRSNKNYFFNCALVSFDYKGNKGELFKYDDSQQSINQNGHWGGTQYKPSGQIVKCRTLQSILDELKIYNIKKFFLDTEGYEFEVLKGINYKKTKILEIDVETHDKAVFKTMQDEEKVITSFLKNFNYYKPDETQTEGHILYKLK